MSSTLLITGGSGFLGQACARQFRAAGWRVLGLGHGQWSDAQARSAGFDRWITGSVSAATLDQLDEPLDVVAHCASNGSVPYSLEQPLDAYERTVSSTAVLLDHLRRHAPQALVLYPSSAAVYGAAPDLPLKESASPNPVSPYGFHKQMVELLLAAHAHTFGQRAIAIRFFSIYGPGLRKQLLWDASARLLSGLPSQTFWGTGDETRDWLHVDDAARLMLHLAGRPAQEALPFDILNGAGGERITVRDVLSRLAVALGCEVDIGFNGAIRAGDPRFYHADITRLRATGWAPTVRLDDGLAAYGRWVRDAVPRAS